MAKLETSLDVNSVSRISASTVVKGEINSPYDIRIDGTFEGKLVTKGRVVIGESAVVQGDIVCVSADIFGKVKVTFYVKDTLSLNAGCTVDGEINTRKLMVELGAKFNGSCKMITEQEFDKISEEMNPTKSDVENKVEKVDKK